MDLARAIKDRQVISFTYDGFPRIVQPATYGRTNPGNLTLRGCQIGGTSRRNTVPCWELYTVSKMVDVQPTDTVFESFQLDGYKRGDSAFAVIEAEV